MCKLSHFGLLFVCLDSTPWANHWTFLLGSFTILNCQYSNGTIVQNKILWKRNLTTLRKYPPKSDGFTNICVHTTRSEKLFRSDIIKS